MEDFYVIHVIYICFIISVNKPTLYLYIMYMYILCIIICTVCVRNITNTNGSHWILAPQQKAKAAYHTKV